MHSFETDILKARAVLAAALYRSFRCSLPEWDGIGREGGVSFLVLASGAFPYREPAVGKKRKLLVFGVPHAQVASDALARMGLKADAGLPPLAGRDACAACTAADHHTESSARLRYAAHSLTEALAPELVQRPFTRFDFTDEWNNLGFGRIRTDGGPWAVQGGVRPDGAVELAEIRLDDGKGESVYAGAYMTLLDTPTASILWCARPVGPVDSTEWSVIERFVSDWRAGDMPCLPCLRRTPEGCRALVTMRLDCDEAVASARDLFEWYASEGVPFSLAVRSGLAMTPADLALLRDVHAGGGTLLSHSHTHALNWGTSFEEALHDAVASRQWFRRVLPDVPLPDLAVSPFHSNPPYAVRALEEAGFTGLVSGIIHNDPEYLLGRAGAVPFAGGRLCSISQQSMLHGDCYRQQGESVEVHVGAFAAQYAAWGIFGYLDHPFSSRYQYGWDSRAQRRAAHQALVTALRSHEDVWFWNQQQCFDFLQQLNRIHFSVSNQQTVHAEGFDACCVYRPVYRLCGEEMPIDKDILQLCKV